MLSSVLELVIGYDAIILNAFLRHFKSRGYLYNINTYELYNLRYATRAPSFSDDFIGMNGIAIGCCQCCAFSLEPGSSLA